MFSANSSQVSDDKLFVEDVFSTYLYTGNGSTQTITNGIDLAGKGGLAWLKGRSSAAGHCLYDTARGSGKVIASNTPNSQETAPAGQDLSSFNSNGFSLGPDYNVSQNSSGVSYASWTFREAPKFFDVVTYTGSGANRAIAHNLGVAPGMVIVKQTNATADWQVYHRSTGNTQYTVLNSTAAAATGATRWNNTTPTATEFTVGTDATVNASGGTYVAYLFAHDPTADGIIQCGSFTTDGSANATVNLGFEPQWLLLKRVDAGSNWMIMDNMRGLNYSALVRLFAESSSAESNTSGDYVHPTATGFELVNSPFAASATYIYIAIRRGPMRTPTLGTGVFKPVTYTGDGTNSKNFTGVGFPSDLIINNDRARDNVRPWFDRLRGGAQNLTSVSNGAEGAVDYGVKNFTMDGYIGGTGDGNTFAFNANGITYANYNFRRAPGFMDVVCYTGTGVVRTVTHNLGVVPTLTIIKRRNTTADWRVTTDFTGFQYLNDPAAFTPNEEFWGYGTPTSTTIPLGINSSINASGGTYVAYLFASAPGVSKVGSYTGNGSSQTINCAFAAGARFVMIKRTDSTGDWYVWDTARGIVAGNDPYLALNTATAEVTTNDSVDPDSSGFVVNQVAATNVNVNAATYIYLAIA